MDRFIAAILVLFMFIACDRPSNNSILLNPGHEAWFRTSPDVYKVEFQTSRGEFILQIDRSWAPLGADRFYNLVRNGYYDDARFHRVVEGFIVQFGLAGSPDITQTWLNRAIPDDPVRQSNLKGTIAFAFTEKGTRSAQLYINMADNIRLDSMGFSPVGKVIQGIDVVEQIYSGYGEKSGGGLRRGNQTKIIEYGNEYLDEEFPLLDQIITARIVE